MDGVDATFSGSVAGDNLGYKTSGAGDLNNDGFSDFIISVPGDDSNGSNSGAVYVFFGDTTISNTPDLVLLGHHQDQGFGSRSIAAGKDINDDGYDDIVIGDNFFSLGSASYEGRIYIYYGGNAMNNEADVVITGKSAGMRLGGDLRSVRCGRRSCGLRAVHVPLQHRPDPPGGCRCRR